MTLEERMRLSFYQPQEKLEGHEHISLVRHTQTGEFFVRKELTDYNAGVYRYLKALDSIYFPKIFEIIEEDGRLILIEEYIRGQTLEGYVQALGTLSWSSVRTIMLQLIEAVGLLHYYQPPIIHRDIKPSNIVRSPEGIWKLVDFNTARFYDAKASRDTTFLGTRSFAAPEQFGDLQTDARTDIYALGAMMNYLLTGESHKKQLVGGEVGRIIENCTRFSPDERYQNIGQLKKDLEQLREPSNVSRESTEKNWEAHGAEPGKAQDGIILEETDVKPEKQKDAPARRKQKLPFAPPGFRTLTPWKMIVAVLSYAMLIYSMVHLELKPIEGRIITPRAYLINQVGFFIMFMMLILFWFNYGGIHARIPLMKSSSWKWRIVGYFLYTCIIAFGSACLIIIVADVWG